MVESREEKDSPPVLQVRAGNRLPGGGVTQIHLEEKKLDYETEKTEINILRRANRGRGNFMFLGAFPLSIEFEYFLKENY